MNRGRKRQYEKLDVYIPPTHCGQDNIKSDQDQLFPDDIAESFFQGDFLPASRYNETFKHVDELRKKKPPKKFHFFNVNKLEKAKSKDTSDNFDVFGKTYSKLSFHGEKTSENCLSSDSFTSDNICESENMSFKVNNGFGNVLSNKGTLDLQNEEFYEESDQTFSSLF